jgi:hypothetical protein
MGISEEIIATGIYKEGEIYSGAIESNNKVINDSAGVMAELKKFGGTGWLCATDSDEIRTYNGSFPDGLEDVFPIEAEAVNGDKSVRLTLIGSSWQFVELTKTETVSGEGLIVKKKMKTLRDMTLIYGVYWKKELEGMKEYRPVAYRLLEIQGVK